MELSTQLDEDYIDLITGKDGKKIPWPFTPGRKKTALITRALRDIFENEDDDDVYNPTELARLANVYQKKFLAGKFVETTDINAYLRTFDHPDREVLLRTRRIAYSAAGVPPKWVAVAIDFNIVPLMKDTKVQRPMLNTLDLATSDDSVANRVFTDLERGLQYNNQKAARNSDFKRFEEQRAQLAIASQQHASSRIEIVEAVEAKKQIQKQIDEMKQLAAPRRRRDPGSGGLPAPIRTPDDDEE